VQDEFGDGQDAGRVQSEHRAGGVTVHRSFAPGLGDEGAYVFDLALDRVGLRVAAVATAPAVGVGYGEALGQFFSQRTGHRPVAGRPTNQDDWRTLTEALEGDAGAVA